MYLEVHTYQTYENFANLQHLLLPYATFSSYQTYENFANLQRSPDSIAFALPIKLTKILPIYNSEYINYVQRRPIKLTKILPIYNICSAF